MKNIAVMLFLAFAGFTGVANAQSGANTMVPESSAANEVAKALVLDSLRAMTEDELGNAVGYATAALDIARGTGDTDLAGRIEKILFAHRIVNMMATAGLAMKKGDGVAAMEIGVLACNMLKKAAPEVAGLIAKAKKLCEPV